MKARFFIQGDTAWSLGNIHWIVKGEGDMELNASGNCFADPPSHLKLLNDCVQNKLLFQFTQSG